MVTNSKHKSNTSKSSNKKGEKVLQVSAEKDPSNVSVITKTTAPKVIIQSENITNNEDIVNQISDKHLLLKFICFVIMCIILLMTFFLSLKTYNAVNDLSEYVHWRIQP
jgi:Fe2+ transport system protein B